MRVRINNTMVEGGIRLHVWAAMTTNSSIRFRHGQAVMSCLTPTRAPFIRHPWLKDRRLRHPCRSIFGYSSGVPRSSFARTNSLQPLLHMMLSFAATSARPASKKGIKKLYSLYYEIWIYIKLYIILLICYKLNDPPFQV